MGIAKILILGVLALIALMFIAQAVVAIIPYLIGLFLLWGILVILRNFFCGKKVDEPPYWTPPE